MATNDSGKGALGGNTAGATPADGGLGTGTAGDPAGHAPAAPSSTPPATPGTVPGQPARPDNSLPSTVKPDNSLPGAPKPDNSLPSVVAKTEGNRPGGLPPEAAAGNADAHRKAAEAAMKAVQTAHPNPPGTADELAQLAVTLATQALALAKQATTGTPGEARVSGIPGGPYTIDGTKLSVGSEPTVTFAGERVKVTSHNAQRVKGQLPVNVKSGEVVVDPGGGAPVVKAQFRGGAPEGTEPGPVVPPPSSQMTQAEKDAQAKVEAEDLAKRKTEEGKQ